MIMKQEGFNYLEEKGLFTFYKEQEEPQNPPYRINLRRQRSNDSYSKHQAIIADRNIYQNKALHSFVSLDTNIVVINSKKEIQNRSPFKVTNWKGNMNTSHSGKKTELRAKSIVELSFEAMSARKQVHKQAQYILKGRAKTEANELQMRRSPSTQKVVRRPELRVYSQLQNNYFSQKVQKDSPKKSTILFRLKKEDTLSKVKSSIKSIKPFLTMQPKEIINENLAVKGVQDKDYQQKKLSIEIRKAELLPQLKKDKGSSIDFWEYFQERKVFFINRYKKAKANKMRQMIKQKRPNKS